MILDSTVVCHRALGCEWGGNSTHRTAVEDRDGADMLAVERFRRTPAELGPNWLEIVTGRGRPDEEGVAVPCRRRARGGDPVSE